MNSSDCINMVLFSKVLISVLSFFVSPSFRYYACAVENPKEPISMNVSVAPQTVALLGEPLFTIGVFPFHIA